MAQTCLRSCLVFVVCLFVTVAAAEPGNAQVDRSRATRDADRASANVEDRDRELERQAARYQGVVDDFYAYDVGVLRGPQAVQARARWERLRDPAAIPAIVRGLNRAVRQGASCPVVAFSSKLRALLRRADDPALGEYVLRHLDPGRGPYGHYINSALRAARNQVLRTKLRKYSRLQLLRRMRKRGQQSVAAVDGDLLRILRGETANQPAAGPSVVPPASGPGAESTSLARLVAGLRAGSLSSSELRTLERAARESRAAELTAHLDSLMTAAANPALPTSHRITAVRTLGRLRARRAVPVLIELLSTNNEQLRQEAATALTRITRRLFGPPPGATREQVEASIRRWRAWWAEQQAHAREEQTKSSGSDR